MIVYGVRNFLLSDKSFFIVYSYIVHIRSYSKSVITHGRLYLVLWSIGQEHASAILRKLGIEELITKTETEYIDLVEKIVLDREFLHNIKCKIKDKENYLYRNENAIRALEDFFEGVISDSLKSEVQN